MTGACFWLVVALLFVPLARAKEVVSPGIGTGYPWSVSWVDVNGDGRSDYCYLYGTDAERVRCFFASSQGTYSSTPSFDSYFQGTGGTLMWWADVDGDGQQDLCRADMAFYSGQSTDYTFTSALWCRLAKDQLAGTAAVTHIARKAKLLSIAGGGILDQSTELKPEPGRPS